MSEVMDVQIGSDVDLENSQSHDGNYLCTFNDNEYLDTDEIETEMENSGSDSTPKMKHLTATIIAWRMWHCMPLKVWAMCSIVT